MGHSDGEPVEGLKRQPDEIDQMDRKSMLQQLDSLLK
jgi:hypothetical protein